MATHAELVRQSMLAGWDLQGGTVEMYVARWSPLAKAQGEGRITASAANDLYATGQSSQEAVDVQVQKYAGQDVYAINLAENPVPDMTYNQTDDGSGEYDGTSDDLDY